MTSRGAEARRKIEAARRRLASARRWTESASRAVESARGHLQTARREEKEAESYLDDTERRREVIDVDSEDDDTDSATKLANKDDGRERRRCPWNTTSGDLGCQCEVEASKRAVETAKKWARVASDAVDSAEGQLRMARYEEEEAGRSLKGAEERLGVIDVDDSSDDDPPAKAPEKVEVGHKRKRTVSRSVVSKDGHSERARGVPTVIQFINSSGSNASGVTNQTRFGSNANQTGVRISTDMLPMSNQTMFSSNVNQTGFRISTDMLPMSNQTMFSGNVNQAGFGISTDMLPMSNPSRYGGEIPLPSHRPPNPSMGPFHHLPPLQMMQCPLPPPQERRMPHFPVQQPGPFHPQYTGANNFPPPPQHFADGGGPWPWWS